MRTNDSVITATFTGAASAHADANDIIDLTFAFADGSFTNLIARVEDKTETGSEQRQEMTESGQAFIDTLGPDELVGVQTI